MMGCNAQRKDLPGDLAEFTLFRKFSPGKLSPRRGVVDFSFQSLRIDKLFVVVWIQKINGRLQVVLKCLAIFTQVMD